MQSTDHFPQFFLLKNANASRSKFKSFKYDYSKFNEEKFLDSFNNVDFAYLDESDTVMNKHFDNFLDDFMTDKQTCSNKKAK